MSTIHTYKNNRGLTIALLIPHDYSVEGISFITKPEDSLQVAAMHHNTNHIIQNHYHNHLSRIVDYTQEVLVIKRGKMLVSLFDGQNKVAEFEIENGDILVLQSGGHGFVVTEDCEFFEIKQGPYLGDADKTKF